MGKVTGQVHQAIEAKELADAKAFAKDELLRDFGKGVSFWKQLKGISMMSAQDYYSLVDSWKLLVLLIEEPVMDAGVVANQLKDIFCPDVDISGYSPEDISAFVSSCINSFNTSVFTEVLKKETVEILKLSLDEIELHESGVGMFDSRQASRFVGEIKLANNKIRYVGSAESAISRMLQEQKRNSASVFMDVDAFNEEEELALELKKRSVFENGIIDVASNKRYIFTFQSPSACRTADFTFVEAKDWNDVVSMWLQITGFESFEAFKEAFFDKEGKVVMAKLIARISTRGSNSFSLSKVAPKTAEKIANWSIEYFEDPTVTISRDFKTLTAPNVMQMMNGVDRIVTPGDGQMIASFEAHADMALAMSVISGNEYSEFYKLWSRVGKDASKVKAGSRLFRLINKIPGVFQLRHGEKKGISVRFNLEAIPELADKQALVPDSVRKFVSQDWDCFPLEICNYLKKKGDYVKLNGQFISALEFENPNALNPIVNHWIKVMEESLADTAKAQAFHRIAKSSDSESDVDDSKSGLVASAIMANSDLINDHQILNWRKAQYQKMINDIKLGRIMVPGQYTYMVCDPALIISLAFDLELDCLAEGEFYFNGKDCEAGLFRAPLIHPFEACKVQLVNDQKYWHMQDVIVFNGLDGVWDRMGGASL